MPITAQGQDRWRPGWRRSGRPLDARQWRLLLGAAARAISRGGSKLVASAVGASPDTVSRGVGELERGQSPMGGCGAVAERAGVQLEVPVPPVVHQPRGEPEPVEEFPDARLA
jgi:hypothetical protein